MLAILIFFHILFIAYFIFVWTWYFSIVPLFFLLFIIFNLGDDFVKDKSQFLKDFFIKNLFVIWRLSINVGILLIGKNFFWLIKTYQLILVINIFFFIISNTINWKDWLLFSHIGLYFWELTFPLYLAKNLSTSNVFYLYHYFCLLNFWIYTFVLFIIWTFKKISNNIKWLWFLFLNLVIINFIYIFFSKKNSYLSLVYTQIYLLLLFFVLSLIKKWYLIYDKKSKKEGNKEDKLTKILNWEKVFTKKEKKLNLQELIKDLRNFIAWLPEYIKLWLWLINLIIILIQIFIFAKHINYTWNKLIFEIWYWIWIIVFLINFLFLKYLNFYHFIQRIFLFFILNFGIYLTIINIFWKNPLYIAIIWTIWNILNWIIIFFIKYLKKFFTKEDFYLRIIANLCAFVINIYFINQIKLNLDIKLWIITLYFGLQTFLTYYNFKYLNNIYEKKHKISTHNNN